MCKKQRYLKISGQLVPVSEDVYFEYMRPWWREKKKRIKRNENEWSYERMQQDDANFEIEDRNTVVEQIVEDKLLLASLYDALNCLTDDERHIVDEIYFKGKSEREIALTDDIPRKTLSYRKEKIIAKLKNIIEN